MIDYEKCGLKNELIDYNNNTYQTSNIPILYRIGRQKNELIFTLTNFFKKNFLFVKDNPAMEDQ